MPKGRKVRLFYQRDLEEDYRYVGWFELPGKDFYWGPAEKTPDVTPTSFSGTEAVVPIPDDLHKLVRSEWKASLHESGVMHVNSPGKHRTRDVYIGRIDDLSKPHLFAALVDKAPSAQEPYRRSLNRNGNAAIVIRLSARTWHNRQILEFYLTPAGTFTPPAPLLKGVRADQLGPPAIQSFGPDPDVLLAVRHYALLPPEPDVRADFGLWLALHRPIKDS